MLKRIMLQKLILNFKKIMIDSAIIDHNGKRLNKILYPIGSIYCTSKNENPEQIIGGKWELVDKEFKNSFIEKKNNECTTLENVSDSTLYLNYAGHTIQMLLQFKPNVNIGDSETEMLIINWNSIGIIGVRSSIWSAFLTDGGDGVVMINISTQGGVRVEDVVPKGTGTSISKGNNIYNTITLVIPYEDMLDEYCDKFYWRRIS